MSAYSWIACGLVALACGGGAFNSSGSEPGGEGGTPDDGGSGGTLGKAGRGTGGSPIGIGGKLANGGNAGSNGVAGDLVTAGTPSMAGEPGMAGSGVGPEPFDEVCPKSVPDVDVGCAAGLTCSYGSDIRAACRTRAKCDSGKWTIDEPDANACLAIHSCASDIVVGNSCDEDSGQCTKEGSKVCACVLCFDGLCQSTATWQCGGPPPQGCPNPIPNEGQPCQGQMVCTYGTCGIGAVTTAHCDGTTWGWEGVACVD